MVFFRRAFPNFANFRKLHPVVVFYVAFSGGLFLRRRNFSPFGLVHTLDRERGERERERERERG